jgi:hypothetical protein
VTSTARPDRTGACQAGRTVIVRPDGDITFIAKVLEQKLNVRNSWAEESRNPVVGSMEPTSGILTASSRTAAGRSYRVHGLWRCAS